MCFNAVNVEIIFAYFCLVEFVLEKIYYRITISIFRVNSRVFYQKILENEFFFIIRWSKTYCNIKALLSLKLPTIYYVYFYLKTKPFSSNETK